MKPAKFLKLKIGLFKRNGGFGLSIGNSRYCIEKSYSMVLNKDKNTVVYKKLYLKWRSVARCPGLFNIIRNYKTFAKINNLKF